MPLFKLLFKNKIILIVLTIIIITFISVLSGKLTINNNKSSIGLSFTSIAQWLKSANQKHDAKVIDKCPLFTTLRKNPHSKEYDRYGGFKGLRGEKTTGFFHIEEIGDKWWLITPEGNAYFAVGATNFYPPTGANTESVSEFRSWGFNSVGAWSGLSIRKCLRQQLQANGIPYAETLNIIESWVGNRRKNLGAVADPPDLFSSEFEETIKRRINEIVPIFKKDRYLIGYFTDNELRAQSDQYPILDSYLKFPTNAPGRKAAEEFLIKWHGKSSLPSDQAKRIAARDEFLGVLGKRYAEATSRIIREADPNHLILGERIFSSPLAWKNTMPERMSGFEAWVKNFHGYFDAITIHLYNDKALTDRIRAFAKAFNGPIFIGEWNNEKSRVDYKLPNNQEWALRAELSANSYRELAPEYAAEPSIIGLHYYLYREKYNDPRMANNHHPGFYSSIDTRRQILVDAVSFINPKLFQIHWHGKQ